MYLVKADYKNRISTDLLNIIIAESGNNGDDILATVSKIAEDTISTLAGVLYSLTAEYAKTGAQRNHLILSWALSIACYEIYQRIPDESVPEKVIKNYNDTITSLEKCSMGKYPLALPPRAEDTPAVAGAGDEITTTDGNGLRRIGSLPRRTNNM